MDEIFMNALAALAKNTVENAGDLVDSDGIPRTGGVVLADGNVTEMPPVETKGPTVINSGAETSLETASVPETAKTVSTPAVNPDSVSELSPEQKVIAKDLGLSENGKFDALIENRTLRVEKDGSFGVYNTEGNKIAKVIDFHATDSRTASWYASQGHEVKYVLSTIGENKPFATVNALRDVGIHLDGSTHNVIYFEDHVSDNARQGEDCWNWKNNQLIEVAYGSGCAEDVPCVKDQTPYSPEIPAEVVATPTPTEPTLPEKTMINNYTTVNNYITNIEHPAPEIAASVEAVLVIPEEELCVDYADLMPHEGGDRTAGSIDRITVWQDGHGEDHDGRFIPGSTDRLEISILGAHEVAAYFESHPDQIPHGVVRHPDGYYAREDVLREIERQRGFTSFEGEAPRGKRIFVNDQLVQVIAPNGTVEWEAPRAPERGSYGMRGGDHGGYHPENRSQGFAYTSGGHTLYPDSRPHGPGARGVAYPSMGGSEFSDPRRMGHPVGIHHPEPRRGVVGGVFSFLFGDNFSVNYRNENFGIGVSGRSGGPIGHPGFQGGYHPMQPSYGHQPNFGRQVPSFVGGGRRGFTYGG